MKFPAPLALVTFFIAATAAVAQPAAPAATATAAPARPYGLVIHGGAGVIERKDMSPELDAQYRAALRDALDAGYAVLDHGGTALDAVIAAVTYMEDSPLFNAGRGAVLNAEGFCEMDASIMNGATLQAGAVAGLQHIKNPLHLARDVMEKSPHVFLIGEGAEKFAWSLGYTSTPAEYFQTDRRRQQLERAKQLESRKSNGTASLAPGRSAPLSRDDLHFVHEQKYGTVGCVALDQQGNLAAGTSTGGMTNKKFGRVGDVPVIGAGTYANNATCAISSTGWGEFFIRASVAHDIAAQVEYAGRDLRAAAEATLGKVARLGGDGGVIGLDAKGNVMTDFNSEGMYRAYRLAGKKAVIAIYGDEPR